MDTEGSVDTEEELVLNRKEARNLKLMKVFGKIGKKKKIEYYITFMLALQSMSEQKVARIRAIQRKAAMKLIFALQSKVDLSLMNGWLPLKMHSKRHQNRTSEVYNLVNEVPTQSVLLNTTG